MLRDEGGDRIGKRRLTGQRDPVGHVRPDDLRRLVRLQPVVRVVAARLVLHEVLRVSDLADVVVIAAHAPEQSVGTDAVAGRLDKVRHRDAVGIRPRRLEGEASQQWSARVRQLEQRDVRGDVCQGLGSREQHVREARGDEGLAGSQQRDGADRADRPARRHAQGERADQVAGADHRRRRQQVAATPQGPDREGGGDPAHGAKEQGRNVVEHRLHAHDRRQDHGGDHRDAAVEQHGERHRLKRERDELRMPRFRPRHDRGPDDAHREQTADQGDLAPVAVHVAAIENHERPEDAEEQCIAEHGTEHATRRPAGRRPAPHEVVVQRDELLVRFVRHDLVGAHDPVAAAHDVLVRIHAPPQLVPAALGLEHVGHKGGPEEMVRQPDVQGDADRRALVGRRGAGPGEVSLIRQDLVAWHGRFGCAAPHDEVGCALLLEHARSGHAEGECALEQVA